MSTTSGHLVSQMKSTCDEIERLANDVLTSLGDVRDGIAYFEENQSNSAEDILYHRFDQTLDQAQSDLRDLVEDSIRRARDDLISTVGYMQRLVT